MFDQLPRVKSTNTYTCITSFDIQSVVDLHTTYLNIILSRSKGYSMIPVVGDLTLRMSCREGR